MQGQSGKNSKKQHADPDDQYTDIDYLAKVIEKHGTMKWDDEWTKEITKDTP
jgi:hypothetical protein